EPRGLLIADDLGKARRLDFRRDLARRTRPRPAGYGGPGRGRLSEPGQIPPPAAAEERIRLHIVRDFVRLERRDEPGLDPDRLGERRRPSDRNVRPRLERE